MSEPTTEEMRERLIDGEFDYVRTLVIEDRNQELYEYIKENCGLEYESDIKTLYMEKFDE